MALHHNVPTEDLSSTVALFLSAGGLLGMLLAVLLWSGPGPLGSATSASSSPREPVGHVPQLVIGAEFGAEDTHTTSDEDMSGLLQWLDSHPHYSVVVVPRR